MVPNHKYDRINNDNDIFILESLGFSFKDTYSNISKDFLYPLPITLSSYTVTPPNLERSIIIRTNETVETQLASTLKIPMIHLSENIDKSSDLVEKLISALLLAVYIEYRIENYVKWYFHLYYGEKNFSKIYLKKFKNVGVGTSCIEIIFENNESYAIISHQKYYIEELLLKNDTFFKYIIDPRHYS